MNKYIEDISPEIRIKFDNICSCFVLIDDEGSLVVFNKEEASSVVEFINTILKEGE